MVKKIGFWKRSWKVFKNTSDFLITSLALTLILILSAYIFLGFLDFVLYGAINEINDFVQYWVILSFTLAGFTFLAGSLFKSKNNKMHLIEIDVLHLSFIFILSGFFGLLFLSLNYLRPVNPFGIPVEYYNFIKNILRPVSVIASMGFFLISLNYLIFILRIRIPELYKKHVKRKFSLKNSGKRIKEIFGFD